MPEDADAVRVSDYNVPEDAGWQDVDSMPEELRRVLAVYAGALSDGVDRPTSELRSIDEAYEIYDQLSGQQCRVAKIGDEIVGVVSFDFKRKIPFSDGIAVASEYRKSGVASELLRSIVRVAREKAIHEIHARSQPSSLEANKRLLAACGIRFSVKENDKYPLIVMTL